MLLCGVPGCPCCSRGSNADAGFASEELQPSDYDTDAIVVHMGGFLVTTPSSAAAATTSGESSHSAEDDDSCGGEPAAALAGKARRAARRTGNSRKEKTVHLQLYSIAAPKMRRLPQHTSDLHLMGWCQAVQQKQGWVQVQKDYFKAPGVCAEPRSSCSVRLHPHTPHPAVALAVCTEGLQCIVHILCH